MRRRCTERPSRGRIRVRRARPLFGARISSRTLRFSLRSLKDDVNCAPGTAGQAVPFSSAHPAVAVAAGPGLPGRRAAGLSLPAHADAQVAILVHAQLHIRKFSGAGRILNAHALALLPGPPTAVAAVKERHAHAASGRAGGRKQRHSSVCHRLSLLQPANGTGLSLTMIRRAARFRRLKKCAQSGIIGMQVARNRANKTIQSGGFPCAYCPRAN